MPAYQPPLPYDTEEEMLKRRQKIAEALLEAGIGNHAGYTSWAQVLGQMANAAAGNYVEGRTDKGLDALHHREIGDYTTALQAFDKDANSGMTPQQLVQKYHNNPMLETALKPYQEAMTEALKGRESYRTFGTDGPVMRTGDIIGKLPQLSPNDSVMRGPNGEMQVNPVKMTASLGAQGLPINNPVTSMMPPVPGNPNNVQAAPAGQTQGGGPAMPTTPTPLVAVGPGGQRIHFNPDIGQWEPMGAGGPTASPSGNF